MWTAECGTVERECPDTGTGHGGEAATQPPSSGHTVRASFSSLYLTHPLESSSSFFFLPLHKNTVCDILNEIRYPLLSSNIAGLVPARSLYYEAVVIVTSQRTPMERWRHCCSQQDIIFEHFQHTIKFKYQDIYSENNLRDIKTAKKIF